MSTMNNTSNSQSNIIEAKADSVATESSKIDADKPDSFDGILTSDFSSSCYSSCDPDFESYDYYEVYDEKKKYPKEKFTANYGKGEKTYLFTKWTTGNQDTSISKSYVLANEMITEEELVQLQKYCQCTRCTASYWNIFRFCICPCCIGCFYSQDVNDIPRQYLLKETRQFIANGLKKTE